MDYIGLERMQQISNIYIYIYELLIFIIDVNVYNYK